MRGTRAELAAWFHDAIYDTTRHDNEARSAELAVDALRALRFDEATIAADADLSILGSDAARYDEYARQIREEYAWVPEAVYRTERAKVLAHFAERPAIYFTSELRERFEGAARMNIERETESLRSAATELPL